MNFNIQKTNFAAKVIDFCKKDCVLLRPPAEVSEMNVMDDKVGKIYIRMLVSEKLFAYISPSPLEFVVIV